MRPRTTYSEAELAQLNKLTILLMDQIPSGKNAMGVRRDGRHYPNPRFVEWRTAAHYDIIQQKIKWPLSLKRSLPLAGNLTATISYRAFDGKTRDLPGCIDALWHLLVYVRLIKDDGQIKGLTWAYPWRTEGPCVEMDIEVRP